MGMVASTTDLLRLAVIPVFAWAAWRDLETRRLPNWLWLALLAFGGGLLIVDAVQRFPFTTYRGGVWLFAVGKSFILVVPLGYILWWRGGMGAADAKAIITLAVLLPVTPEYAIGGTVVPLVAAPHGTFPLTIVSNAVLAAALVPVAMAVYNLSRGWTHIPGMFISRRVSIDSLPDRAGKLIETSDTRRASNGPDMEGDTVEDETASASLDLDVLRMYLRWRGITLATLRANPELARQPDSIGETHSPSDGRVDIEDDLNWGDTDSGQLADPAAGGTASDGGECNTNGDSESTYDSGGDAGDHEAQAGDDPWGAAAFINSIDRSTYGVNHIELRRGLDVIADPDRDQIAVRPGVPFIIPLFVGIVTALTYGDILFAGILRLLGGV